MTQYLKQNKYLREPINFNHLPVLPNINDRHEFIGKWFRGGEGGRAKNADLDGDHDDEIDYDLKGEYDDDLEG